MTKKEKYEEFLKNTNFTENIATSIVGNEILARVLLKILMDKKIVSTDEYMAAMSEVTGWFVRMHNHDFEDENEPDVVNLTPDDR